MATGIHVCIKPHIKLMLGHPPCPRKLYPELLGRKVWRAKDARLAAISVEAAYALEDFSFLISATNITKNYPEDDLLKCRVDEYTAQISNWLPEHGLALHIVEPLYFRATGIERLKCAVTYADALANLGRLEEASEVLNSNPPPPDPKFRRPKGKLKNWLSRTLSPDSGKLPSLINSTLACRHTLVAATVERARGNFDLATIMLRGASRMKVAPLYTPLLRVRCAHELAKCNSYEEARHLLARPMEHHLFPQTMQRWQVATSELLGQNEAQPATKPA